MPADTPLIGPLCWHDAYLTDLQAAIDLVAQQREAHLRLLSNDMQRTTTPYTKTETPTMHRHAHAQQAAAGRQR